MEATSSDGQIRTFELSLEKFHELRYNVAKVLKDMEDLEQIPILKIDKWGFDKFSVSAIVFLPNPFATQIIVSIRNYIIIYYTCFLIF